MYYLRYFNIFSVISVLMLVSVLAFNSGCSTNLSGDTKDQCAEVGQEQLCEIAGMKGFIANAMENANDALEQGKIDEAMNETVHDIVQDAHEAVRAYEQGEGKLDGVISVVESLGLKMLELGLTQ